MVNYVRLSVLKDRIGTPINTDHDAMLEMIIQGVSRAIDRLCKRPTNAFVGTAAAVRVYDVEGEPAPYFGGWDLARSDAPSRQPAPAPPKIGWWAAVTAVKTDDDGDGVYETTWATTDYELLPPNAAAEGRPYTHIRERRGGTKTLLAGANMLQITGTFGEVASATDPPDIIREATILMAHRLYERRKSALGRTAAPQEMGGSIAITRIDPDVVLLLDECGYIERFIFA